jgi:hypothetical protein
MQDTLEDKMELTQVMKNWIASKLGISELEVYLTGSRFFGTDTEISDFDFFVGSTLYAPLNLNKLSPEFNPISYYGELDVNTCSVYRAVVTNRTARIQIDLQIVKDIDKKVVVQNKILNAGLGSVLSSMPKLERKKLWNYFFAEYEQQKNKEVPYIPFDVKKHRIDLIKAVRTQYPFLSLLECKCIVETLFFVPASSSIIHNISNLSYQAPSY